MLGAQAELPRCDLLRAPPHVARDVDPRDANVLAGGVDPPDDDVHVRVFGVVVVDRGPKERLPEVLAHASHQLAGKGVHVQLAGVLRRDDETELPPLPGQLLAESVAVERVIGAVKDARGTVALDAIPLEVVEVQAGGVAPAAVHRNVVRLDQAAP